MSDTPSALSEVMQKTRGPGEEHAEGWRLADKVHALLPDWLSARAAVMKNKAQLRALDAQTAEEPRRDAE